MELVKKMGRGLIVTELLGHGLNMVTGDYSRGAAGLWVENGEVQFAVEEITIASNIKDMLLNIEAVATDRYTNSSKYTGSIHLLFLRRQIKLPDNNIITYVSHISRFCVLLIWLESIFSRTLIVD